MSQSEINNGGYRDYDGDGPIKVSRRGLDPYIVSKLTKLETDLERYKEDWNRLMHDDENILKEIKVLREDVTRMKGFIGGVAFVFSGIGVAAGLAVSYFSGK